MLIITNGIVEVIENLFISNQPLLVRINTWGQTLELRADKKELRTIIEYLETFTKDISEDTEY